jgi:hypothetical protein
MSILYTGRGAALARAVSQKSHQSSLERCILGAPVGSAPHPRPSVAWSLSRVNGALEPMWPGCLDRRNDVAEQLAQDLVDASTTTSFNRAVRCRRNGIESGESLRSGPQFAHRGQGASTSVLRLRARQMACGSPFARPRAHTSPGRPCGLSESPSHLTIGNDGDVVG